MLFKQLKFASEKSKTRSVFDFFRREFLRDRNSGSGMVEILVAIFIFTIVLGSLITASNQYLTGAGDNLKSAKAAYIAEEGVEAIKIIRDTDWDTVAALSNNTNYYLYWNTSSSTNNTWYATTTSSLVDTSFTRTFTLEAVYRDSNGKIQQSGTLDVNTRKLTVTVSWSARSATTTKSLSTYITNII